MPAKIFATVLLAALPAAVSAAWQAVATEQGKRVEIDRESIAPGPGAALTAKGRIVLDKPIVDPKTSASYRVIEIESRYDCAERTYATLKRIYYREEGEIVREEEVRSPFEMPVRSGTPDYRLFREACRPKGGASEPQNVNGTLDNNAVTAQVVPISDVRLHLPADTPTVTPQQYAASLKRRMFEFNYVHNQNNVPTGWATACGQLSNRRCGTVRPARVMRIQPMPTDVMPSPSK